MILLNSKISNNFNYFKYIYLIKLKLVITSKHTTLCRSDLSTKIAGIAVFNEYIH
jgi:hypothetical protein